MRVTNDWLCNCVKEAGQPRAAGTRPDPYERLVRTRQGTCTAPLTLLREPPLPAGLGLTLEMSAFGEVTRRLLSFDGGYDCKHRFINYLI